MSELNMPVPQGSQEMQVSKDATGAIALIQAAYSLALMNPRDKVVVLRELAEVLEDYDFAKMAVWEREVGKKYNKETREWETEWADGWSIHFAKEMRTQWGNIVVDSGVSWEDDDKRKIWAMAVDVEKNAMERREKVIEKTVERSNAKGREVISQRENSYGKTTYKVKARDDEVEMKDAGVRARMLRDVMLAVMPSSMLLKLRKVHDKTIWDHDTTNLEETKTKLAKAFAARGVTEDLLNNFLGHPSTEATVDDIRRLRGMYNAMTEGASWVELTQAESETHAASPEKGTIDISAIKPGDPETHTEPDQPVTQPDQPSVFDNEQSAAMVIDAFFMYLDEQDVSDAGKTYAKELICKRFKVAKLNKIPDTKALEVDEYISGIVKAEMQRESFLPMPRA